MPTTPAPTSTPYQRSLAHHTALYVRLGIDPNRHAGDIAVAALLDQANF